MEIAGVQPWVMRAQSPDVIQAVPALCMCVVVNAKNSDPISGYPPNVNFASAFTYDVVIDTPNGTIKLLDCIPSMNRYERPWLVEAFEDRSDETRGEPFVIPGGIINGKFFLFGREERWAAPCGWTPTIPPPPTPGTVPNLPPSVPPPPSDEPPPGTIPTEPSQPPPMLAPPRLDYPGVGP